MALTITQGVAVSYPAIIAENRKAANQWEESALLHKLEKTGGIVRKSLGETIEVPLDYKSNPGGGFMVSDLVPLSQTKTEVITSASYSIAQIAEPITWTNMDEVKNPSDNQKIALVAQLLTNGLSSHDDTVEKALFQTSTQGFLGLPTHISTAGTGSDGGIDSSVETWWGNQQATYVDDTDIEAAFTTVWNACAKGTGSKIMPTIMVSDGPTQALFEGTQQALQRWGSGDELAAGFKVLKFKNADYVFSQYGTTTVFFFNPKTLQVIVSKEYFRDRSETRPLPNAMGYFTTIYSALQTVTNNRSRIGCAHT
jgi:hypothetical protein